MQVKTIILAAALSVGPNLLHAQFDFHLGDRDVQVHSFASQGYMYSNVNNYMTMKTSQGSFAMTDGGVNASVQLTDKFRVGAQGYIRDFGRMGQWHPQLDWAYADYRFKDWFGIRGGKVKTVLGLFNDTQDNDSLHTFALLPQSVYPTDLRDATIAHTGGDVYGNIAVKHLGGLSYTLWAGHRQDTRYGGYTIMVQDRGIGISSYSGLQYGADVKWSTPLKGLLVGGSHMTEDVTGTGSTVCVQALASINCVVWNRTYGPNYMEHSKKDYVNFGYAEYTIGNLRVDGEYRRYWRDQAVWNDMWETAADTRGWYTSATYRISKRLEVGSYYSQFLCKFKSGTKPASYNTSLPGNHIYDKVVTARVDLTKFWNIKVEGHFMDGYGTNQSPDGFYAADNPKGFQPKTNLLIVRTGWSF
jgi:hypothetical protein